MQRFLVIVSCFGIGFSSAFAYRPSPSVITELPIVRSSDPEFYKESGYQLVNHSQLNINDEFDSNVIVYEDWVDETSFETYTD